MTEELIVHVIVPLAEVPDNPVAEPHDVGEERLELLE